MFQIVDKAAWPRRELFDFFSPMSQPFFSVTFRQVPGRIAFSSIFRTRTRFK